MQKNKRKKRQRMRFMYGEGFSNYLRFGKKGHKVGNGSSS